jgi:hypothetical protein
VRQTSAHRYANIERIYTLPRPQPAGSLVIVHLETAIRRGQTYYEWIAFFFDDKAHTEVDLNATQEVRAVELPRSHAEQCTVDLPNDDPANFITGKCCISRDNTTCDPRRLVLLNGAQCSLAC